MSECSCFGTLNPPDDNRVGTVGRPLPGGDELTPTMKLKRRVILQKYAAEIEQLYG